MALYVSYKHLKYMAIMKIIKSEVDRLPYIVEPKKQKIYFDTELKGFGLLVGQTSKSYIVQRDIAGKTCRINIGRCGTWTAEEARKEARQLLAEMDRGNNPKKQKQAEREKSLTLEQAYKVHVELLKRNESSPKTIEGYELCLKSYLKSWKNRLLHEITRSEARELHTKLGAKHGIYAANRAMKCFRAIYNTAMKEYDYLPTCPTIAVHWFKEHRRQEPIPAEKLPKWFQEVNTIHNPVRRDYQLFVLFTGLRRRDTASIRWEDIDIKKASLHRPNPKGGKERAFTLPLSNFCLEILERRKKQNAILFGDNCPWVFPTYSKKHQLIPIQEPKEQRRDMPSPHRLRDTYTTAANGAGLSPYDIDVLTNHRPPKGSVTAGYIRQDFEYLRVQQQRVTNYLKEKIGFLPAKAHLQVHGTP